MSNLSLYDLAKAVQAHAEAHYADGWDVIVECYNTDELEEMLARELLGRPFTPAEAIKQVALTVNLREEVRQDILAAGGLDRHGNEIIAPVEEPEVYPRPVIEVEAATSLDKLAANGYSLPEATRTGVVCGGCSQEECKYLGDRKAQVRHATAGHVRYCFDAKADMEAEARAEALAERRTEQYFEGAFREPSADDLYEEARDRWLESLQGR